MLFVLLVHVVLVPANSHITVTVFFLIQVINTSINVAACLFSSSVFYSQVANYFSLPRLHLLGDSLGFVPLLCLDEDVDRLLDEVHVQVELGSLEDANGGVQIKNNHIRGERA